MSPGEAIYAALGPLFGGRVWPLKFEQVANRPVWPALRYTTTGVRPYLDQCGNDAGDTDDLSFQLDIVDTTYDGMLSLVRAVRLALQATDPPCTIDGGGDDFDQETSTFRYRLDVTFWPSSADDSPA